MRKYCMKKEAQVKLFLGVFGRISVEICKWKTFEDFFYFVDGETHAIQKGAWLLHTLVEPSRGNAQNAVVSTYSLASLLRPLLLLPG